MDQDFEAFYALYPKKRSKGDAEKAWKALKPDAVLVTTIIAAVACWRKTPEWLKEGGKFIPYPGTWLRAKGWEDELPGKLLPTMTEVRPKLSDNDKPMNEEERARVLKSINDLANKFNVRRM